MSDQFGPLEFPAQLGDGALSDPSLDKLGAYLLAVLNSQLGASWNQVAPGSQVVKNVVFADPLVIGILDNALPALYIYRQRLSGERISDDWYCDHSHISVVWMPAPIPQAQQQKRNPFFNGVAKVIERALIVGRDPSWVDPGDDDPTAVTRGSQFVIRCGMIYMPSKPHVEPRLLRIPIADGTTRRMPTVYATLECWEGSTWDPVVHSIATSAHTTDVVNEDGSHVFVEVKDPLP